MEIKTIAIVGAGEQGRNLAYKVVLAGYRTILEDISPSTVEQGIVWIGRALSDDVSRDAATRDATLANLSTANLPEYAAREADLIVEAVADEIEMKIELFTIFDKFAKPGAIFASTTTSVSITDLASMTFCPGRCIGMRFFTDDSHVQRLELVLGRETSEETIVACREVGRRMGNEVVVVGDDQQFATGCPDCGAA